MASKKPPKAPFGHANAFLKAVLVVSSVMFMFNFLIQPLHRFLRVFVVGAVITLCATVAQAQDVEGRVSVGLYKSPPFVMTAEDGALTGMAVDLWERLAEALELETEYVFYDSLKDLTDAAASGDINVAVTNMTITKERAKG